MPHANKKRDLMERYNNSSYIQIYDNRYRRDQYDKIENIMQNFEKQQFQGIFLDFGAGTGLFFDYIKDHLTLRRNEKKEGESSIEKTASNVSPSKTKKNSFLNSAIKFIAIDLSIGMLKVFQNKLDSRNFLDNQVQLICADGENLPFRNKKFAKIFAFTSLQNLPEPELGLNEIYRVFKPDLAFSSIAISFLKKSLKREELSKIIKAKFPKYKILNDFTQKILEDWQILILNE